MATTSYQIVYWRAIPAQVKVKVGRERTSRPLSERFQVAIDEAAMRAGMIGTDEYLAEWRTSDSMEQEGEANAVADAVAADLETQYSPERLKMLVDNWGREPS